MTIVVVAVAPAEGAPTSASAAASVASRPTTTTAVVRRAGGRGDVVEEPVMDACSQDLGTSLMLRPVVVLGKRGGIAGSRGL